MDSANAAKTLLVEVVRIEGRCDAYEVGDSFRVERGWLLVAERPVCMHALSALLPYYVALSRGVTPRELGLAREGGEESDAAFLRCPDPCDITGGGSVTFRVRTIEG